MYTISPESFTRNIVSAAEYRIDDGPWQAGQSGKGSGWETWTVGAGWALGHGLTMSSSLAAEIAGG